MISVLLNQTNLSLQRISEAETLLLERSRRIEEQLNPLQIQTTTRNEKIEASTKRREGLLISQAKEKTALDEKIKQTKDQLNQAVEEVQKLEKERQALHQQALGLQQRVNYLNSPLGVRERCVLFHPPFKELIYRNFQI